MALTRKLLKDMQLDDSIIEEIIAAHAASLDGLIAERDELRAAAAEAEALRLEAEALREAAAETSGLLQERDELLLQADQLAQARADAEEARRALVIREAEELAAKRDSALRAALLKAGCNEAAVELVAREVSPDAIRMEEGVIVNAEEIIAPLRMKYAALFAKPVRLPTTTVTPPIASGGALTLEDLSHMSEAEINRNWNAVKGVLSKGVI